MDTEKMINLIIYLSLAVILVTMIGSVIGSFMIAKDIENKGGIGKTMGMFIKDINEGMK